MNIIKDVYAAVINGEKESVLSQVQEALNSQIPPAEILNDGLIAPMDEIGDRFQAGDIFVPEMLIAAKAMKAGLELIKPHLVDVSIATLGTVVIGTVKGDLHDIGKNLVGIMLEGAGFEVVDLGTDVAPEVFAKAAREQKAKIIGLSALLTTTMVGMKETIEAIEDFGIRNDVKVIVGGAPVTEDFAKKIQADGYAPDAGSAVKLVKSLL